MFTLEKPAAKNVRRNREVLPEPYLGLCAIFVVDVVVFSLGGEGTEKKKK